MKRVLVSDTLSEQGLAILRSSPELEVDYRPGLSEPDLAAAIPGAQALLIRSGSKVTARVIDAATTLKVIGRAGIGVDNVDVPAATRRGIVVMNTPTGNAVTTAEHAIALLFALARHVPQAAASMRGGKWEKKKFEGVELSGKTLGVIGLGNIGRIVADRAKGLSMKVIAFDPVLSAERAAELGIELVPIDRLWAEADAITVHTPLTKTTRGLVNDEVVAKLKKGVLLVNAARGGIYDEAAILRGLESGTIGGVALDVFPKEPPEPSPLYVHERCILTPHLGASTREAQDRVALEIAEQVKDFLATGATRNAVNAPSVTGEMASKLAPYTDLAERLGSFLAQVDHLAPASIEVECVGEPGDLNITAITAAAVTGYLAKMAIEDQVNRVSAPGVARDRGIAIVEKKSKLPEGKHTSVVVLRVTDKDGRVADTEGTLSADESSRLCRWGAYDIDARLGGTTLVVTHFDKPGVIGYVGTTLGKAGVNVARVNVGLAGNGTVVSVWNLDQEVPHDVLGEMRKSDHISGAVTLTV
jgi:D-3-phosphoglycerate dehydrogenase